MASPSDSLGIVKVCVGHTRPVTHLRYSNIIEGTHWIISSCKDGNPMLRNGETGDWVGTFSGHKGCVWSGAFDSNALRVATASADFTSKIWDALTGNELVTFNESKIVKSIDFTQDDSHIVCGGMEKTVKLYDLVNYNSAPTILHTHTDSIQCILSVGSNTIVSCSRDKTVQFIDTRQGSNSVMKTITLEDICTGIELSKTTKSLASSFGSTSLPSELLSSSPMSSSLLAYEDSHNDSTNYQYVTITAGNKIVSIDPNTLEIALTITLDQPGTCATLARSGRWCLVGGCPGINWVRAISTETGQQIDAYKGHHGPVHTVSFSPDFSSFTSGGEDGTLRIWSNKAV